MHGLCPAFLLALSGILAAPSPARAQEAGKLERLREMERLKERVRQLEVEKLKECVRQLEQENARLRADIAELKESVAEVKKGGASPGAAGEKKKRLGALMKEAYALHERIQKNPELRDDPATRERMQALEEEGEALMQSLTGGDRAKQNAMAEEIMKQYASELAPALAEARASAEKVACANNLCQLYKAMHVYVATFGKNSNYPPHTGATFFLCLAGKCGEEAKHAKNYAPKAPLYESDDVFKCPSAGSPAGSMDYLGPSKRTPADKPSALSDSCDARAPIACDKPGNHKDGGNVLYFDGSVRFLTGAEYHEALKSVEREPAPAKKAD